MEIKNYTVINEQYSKLRDMLFTSKEDKDIIEHVDCGYKEFKDFFVESMELQTVFAINNLRDNFMTEFTDQDTGLLNISKYDHEEIINFFNKEIK